MSYAQYLASIVRALRDEVAPGVATEQGREAVGACIRSLAMMTATLERAEHRIGPSPPGDIPGLTATEVVRGKRGAEAGLLLPTTGPVNDIPGGTAWHDVLLRAQHWLRARGTAEEGRSLLAVIHWERELRREHLGRADAMIGAGPDANGATAGGTIFLNVSRDALEAYLRAHYRDPSLAVTSFRQRVGGRSRQTVLAEIAGAGGVQRIVCQRDHPAGIHPDSSVEIQYALLATLFAAGLRVPRPLLFETDRAVLGAPFMVTEQVDGSVVIDPATDYFAPPPKSARLAISLARQMARLHGVPVAQAHYLHVRMAGPAAEAWHKDMAWLRDTWRERSPAPSLAVDAAFDWMERNIGCIGARTAIVHGDMLLHNVLAEDEEITAVLDWENARLGHPAEDLGYVRPVIEQMVDWPKFMAAYEAAGGAAISRREIDWFSLRAMMVFAVMAQGSGMRLCRGETDDVRVTETIMSWLPRLIDRLANVLTVILARES